MFVELCVQILGQRVDLHDLVVFFCLRPSVLSRHDEDGVVHQVVGVAHHDHVGSTLFLTLTEPAGDVFTRSRHRILLLDFEAKRAHFVLSAC